MAYLAGRGVYTPVRILQGRTAARDEEWAAYRRLLRLGVDRSVLRSGRLVRGDPGEHSHIRRSVISTDESDRPNPVFCAGDLAHRRH